MRWLALITISVVSGCTAISREENDTPPSEAALGSNASGTVFNTSGQKLNVRAEPTTQSAVVATLSSGTKVKISCQVTGQTVSGNSIWDYLPAYGGYVADAFLYTGHAGVIPGVETCHASGGGCGNLDYRGACQGD